MMEDACEKCIDRSNSTTPRWKVEGRQVEKEEFQHNQEVKFHEAKS